MIVTGASVEDIAVIVRAVSATRYNGNVEIRDISDKSSSRTVRTSFTLRVKDGHAGNKGASGRASAYSRPRNGGGPRGLICSPLSACWHAHYDVIEALFSQTETVKITSALATYTPGDFHREAIVTSRMSMGPPTMPIYPTDLCECEHCTDDEVAAAILVHHPARDRGASQHYAPAGNFSRETYPRESELGKYASDGAYEAELTRCRDCGCTS